MPQPTTNYAFIDSQNLNLATRELGWNVDWRKFRVYLKEKYKVEVAYLFVGHLPENQEMYDSLESAGYVLIFKPILKYADGSVKGNCDAELVLQAMIDYDKYDQALIVSGDGDFYCLVNYLYDQKKLAGVLAPNERRYSALLKTSAREKIYFMNKLKKKLAYRKRPRPEKAAENTPNQPAGE